jgi:hypothetical protein
VKLLILIEHHVAIVNRGRLTLQVNARRSCVVARDMGMSFFLRDAILVHKTALFGFDGFAARRADRGLRPPKEHGIPPRRKISTREQTLD